MLPKRREVLNLPTAKKLPSGSWRCRVYSHTDQTGKKIYKSFTCDDTSPRGKKKCEQMAIVWGMDKQAHFDDITLREAYRLYIDSREHLLSPSTVKEYRRQTNKAFPELMDLRLSELTQQRIQRAVNAASISRSPKTVRNMHGFLSAVLGAYRPDLALRTDLPKNVRPKLHVPTEEEMRRILRYVEGDEMEIPILLAAFGPMRRSEICALRSDHIQGNTVHVDCALVQNVKKEWVLKAPKSYAGDRYITFPDFVIAKMDGIVGRITNLNPAMVTLRFRKILKDCGVPHFRFHDLRHYSASVQHALGIPDSYIMQRGGWGSDKTLKAVYRHVMEDKEKQMNDIANSYFSQMYDTKYDTNKKNP